MRGQLHVGIFAAGIALACSSTPPPLPSFAAANSVGPDSPLYEGQYRFLYDSWGTEGIQGWPPTAFMKSLMTSEPAVFGNQYASFGFIQDPNDDFPVGFKPGLVDPTHIGETCALCHTAQLPDGRIWFGAPNTKLDIGRFSVEVNKRWVAAGNPPMFTDLELGKMALLGPGRESAESSSYPQVVGADFPPYFELGKRTHLNYLGTGANVRTEASFAIYTFGAGSPDDQLAVVPFPTDDRLNPFLDFFGSFEPPAGPAQDPGLAGVGAMVFQTAGCGGCHHEGQVALDGIVTLDKSPDTVERQPGDDPTFPRGSINTDPQHMLLDTNSSANGMGGDNGYDNLLKFMIAHKLDISGTDGYTVSDVRGLWATAPYLHNGSVPTLEDLLMPAAERPVTWQNGSFTFDTTQPGNSNQGHEFGTNLSPLEKAALVAYLKSL